MRIYDFHVCFAPLIRGSMPKDSAAGRDSMSDKEAARLFNPAYLRKCLDFVASGIQLLQFVVNLVFSPWLSSQTFSVDEITRNALSGYYLVVSLVHHAYKMRGNRWPLAFLPRRTTQNILPLVCTKCYLMLFAPQIQVFLRGPPPLN